MRKIFVFLAMAVLFALPSAALALEASVDSSTYLMFRETLSERNIAPLYEYLDLDIEKIASKDISFHAGGWLRADLGDKWAEDKFESELGHAYLSLGLSPGTLVNLGRVYVFEGVASEVVDGLYAKANLSNWFALAAYGGQTVEEESGDIESDYIAGGRISHHRPGLYSIGLSYLKQQSDADDAREEEGVDIWLRPLGKFEIQGRSNYNAESSGWMEHSYYISAGPFGKAFLNGEFSITDYEHYFSAPTLSAFEPTQIDPDEEITVKGGSLDYSFSGSLSATLEYKNFGYDIKGSADYLGGALRYSRQNYTAGLSAHRMDGESDDLKYSSYRAYASKKLGKADLSLDILHVSYDREISGVSKAYTAAGSAGYQVASNASCALDLEYSENPFFDSEFRVLFKFHYKFTKGA